MSDLNFYEYIEQRNQKASSFTRAEAYSLGQQSKQVEFNRLNSVLDERTKEWLQAIECGTYFENVAKPLKKENDNLKNQLSLQRDRNKALEVELANSRNYGDSLHSQLNNMEQCYIGMKKERDGLLDANTARDKESQTLRDDDDQYFLG